MITREEAIKSAINYHSDFINESFEKIKSAADNGKFSIDIKSSDEEIRALFLKCKELGYTSEVVEGIVSSNLFISW